jgi:hypothetical protein
MTIKQFFTIFLMLCVTSAANAQVPQAFNYQAIVRDAQGNPLSNQAMNFEVSIVQNNAAVYGETQSKTTNSFGLVDIKVGQGTVFQGSFAGINWSNGAAMIRVKVNGVILPESPIVPVPLALYALKSGGSAADSWTSVGNNIFRANGNVGIGTSVPAASLNVDPKGKGGILIGNPSTGTGGFTSLYMSINAQSGGSSYIQSISKSGSAWGSLGLNPQGGDVGIGTDNPQTKLHVNGRLRTEDVIYSYGALFVDLRRYSGNDGRNGLFLFSSGDNDASAIITNTNTFHFWSTKRNGDANIHAGQGSFSVLEVRGADIVEKFKSKETIEAGTLVTIDDTDTNNFKTTDKAYQKGIVGIVSGANGVKHGMLLQQDDVLAGNTKVTIAGRVYVKATAQNGAIKAGDFLTSANTAGYAMKSTNRRKAYGAVIGKALTSLESGEGYVLVLVGLQ